MTSSRFHTRARRAVLPACIATALAPALLFAQDAPSGEAQTLDRIEVTGSRIKRADIETSQPVLMMQRQDIEKQGLVSVADVLQRISTNGAALSTTYNNGGDGSASISLRNLESGRTLVLFNGRRWSSQITGDVDLNTIPASIIERVEVLKDGASTIYGSDAIAGVVNIITRKDFEGAEGGAYFGQFGQGDGARQSYDFTIGARGERSSAMLGVSYTKEDPVMAGARAISAGGPPFFTGQSGTGFPGSFVNTQGTPSNADDQRMIYIDGVLTPYVSAVHGYNTSPDNYLLTPQERTSLYAQGSIDIAERLTFRTEALYNERISEQLLAAMPVTGMTLSADSLYNPLGYDLIGVNRRFIETGGRSFNQNAKTWHFFGGFEGYFDVGERTFDWDVGFRYDRTDQNDLTYGLFKTNNLDLAYGPSEMRDGVPVCVEAPGGNIIAGCVPVNPLGPNGSITQAALDYTSFTAHDSYRLMSRGGMANISGELFDLPGGPLAFAAGLERRTESGQFDPDAFIASGLSTGNGSLPTQGSYSLDEAYLELSIPILADAPLAKLLDVSLATRYSDYSNFGDTTNSKFGFRWKPIDDLMVRGNYTQGFRAPSINSLYAGDTDSYESYADPCSVHNPQSTIPQVAARCAAEGVPAGFEQPGDGSSRQTLEPFIWKSNDQLQPETATTKTLGLVFSPHWLPGFDISVDWWNIRIENAFTRPEAQFIVDKCYLGTAGEQAVYCALFSRDPAYPGDNYIITQMDMPLLNLASYDVEGYDVTLNYRLPETRFGQFRISWDSTYTSNWSVKATEDSEEEQRQGLYFDRDPYWRIKSNLFLDWSLGDWAATWGMRYKSGIDEACPFDGQDAQDYCSDPGRVTADGPSPRNRMGATLYNDIQLRWNAPWNATVAIGSNNVFDRAPPLSLTTAYNLFDPQYDLPGRFVYLQYRQRF